MAERPLYTLYKNLKAQNYDVPDDYNKFESALTRDGKGGADNRHAIYENLKAQNFDVPSTYERFYSALFEPRSKTSSRAKGGSVPMSTADRARYLAVTQSVLNTARQVKRASGNIRKTVERAKKFNANDGKVTIGFKNPLQNQNVQKNEFNYNSTTGKTGTYTTTDGVEFDNEYDASQYQNQLDKQGQQYINAVNAGEIPSAFDVRDKKGNYDLQENIGKNGTYLTEEGAQKQFDKKLADAYARKKEIEALIAEDNRQHGNPLLSYGASIGASNGRTAEQSDYRNKLATSLSLVTEQIGALEAVKQYPTSSWGEDALKALDNTAFTAKTWDFGLTDFATMGQMERIKTKMDNNIPLSGSDKMLLKSKLGADAAAALEDEKMGNIYRWTKIAGQNLPFMADFFLTGGYGGITKGISRGALKFAAKRGMGKVGAAILKNTGIVAGDVIGSYAMAGTEQALKTGADIMQRHLGNLYQDEKGDYKFGTFDENGNLLHEGGESIGTALYKGMTSAMVENYTEKLFGHNYGIKKGAVNFMEKHGMNASAEFFKNIGKSGWYTNSKKWMEKFGINGFAEEVMEEEIGIPLHALLDGEGKVSDLLDAKQQLDIIGGMAISVGSMYAMCAGSRPVKGIYNRAQYYRFRNKVNVADSDAQNLMGDNWADIKDKIDNATNEQMGGVLADILRQRDTMTKEQINAAVNYGVNLMKMRGYNIAKTAEMNAKEITNEPTTPEEQHQADIDNAYSEGHDADDADKHDIQIQQEDQMKTLAAALGISEQQLSAMSDEELESLTGQDDKLDQAIYDYQLSSARYQGVVDDAQDKVDLAAHQAEQRVDMYTDQSRGSVRNATIKASGGLEDYGVYIISGNIATHEDGSIDVSNSDDMILYYDPTTNSVEHADALMFAELGEELPADDVKAQAVADAKENAIKEVAGIIDGTVEVGSQFNVTDTDGTEHTYEVLADYGDGTAAISIDGNVVENPYSLADLQQMKDLEDQKRLEAAKAEREQMEKERAAQQTQETEETQPSFDFNQILNDDGNVVLVDVLDKDGNTKYPDSRLFLIRDAGAKAKVVELKSDGTLVPHAVNKEDVATISSMSLDEYKQAMPESSMIEDNSGEESDEDSQLENLGLPKGSEIWMSGDGFGRPKENTLSKVVGIDEQGSIILEDKDGKKWSASFDYINNHRELPPLDENTNIVNEENNQSESNAEENTPAPEQTPAMTLEDGTIVPMLEDGNPDFSKLTAAQTAELYDTQFGEDADSIVSGYVSDAKKALDKASNMTVKGKTFVEQKAAKDAKEKAIADAQAAYDSAIAIRDAYNKRQLAKVEDTAEGRKELIEKARRKFARLKSAVKDDAEAVSQLYRDTIGSLLHRLYDSTGIDVTDTTPLTAEEYVASNLGAHSLNYEGTETSKGVKQETGLSREDFAKTQLLAADGKGTTIDALVHSLWENRPSNLESLDTQDIRNALIGVLNSGFKASEARNFVENIRIAQAENILEEQKRAQENAAYAEQHKAEPEAELKAKSDEKAELKAKSEAKLDNESSNESNDLSNETDNEKINDNINDNINVPEDATDENPLGAQRDESDLPFSAKENGMQQTTAVRAADVEKNKVNDMKVVDNIVGQKTRKAFERLAKMMGANIQWQYSDKLGNGWIQETKDADGNVHRTIFITLDSSITEGAQFIFGHEMTHQIKNLNPAAYNELTQLVLDTYGSDAFDKAVDETMQRYSDAGFSGRARDYYAEEVVADSVGEMIRDLNLAHTLAMKMSHPLLAAIHEILQKIKLAFFGTEYSDVTKNIIRSIEQAYVKTANGQVTNSETGEDVAFSLRQKPEPKKKGVGYKVFVLKDGKLYPPMVANPDGAATPVGVWLDADAAPIAGESKTGRPQVKQGGKGTQGGSGKLAYRPGWHLGVVPYAIQFNRKDAEGNKTLFPKNFVFAEVEYAADVDYQEEARQEGINPSGKYQHSLAGLKHLPTDGYYMYRTNPNPETDPWVITGAMKVNRILTRAEQAELVKNAGREPQQIQEGDIVTDDVVNSINQEIAAAPKFSLKVYHGSGADFTEFDFDHMGEGAGSQAFGWGGYVTSSKKIGKDYARLGKETGGDYQYMGDTKLTSEQARVLAVFVGLPAYKEYSSMKEGVGAYIKSLRTLEQKGGFMAKHAGERIKVLESVLPKLDKVSRYDFAHKSRNLYEVDIPEDNGSNYIEFYEDATPEFKEQIKSVLANGLPSELKKMPEYKEAERKFYEENGTDESFEKSLIDDALFELERRKSNGDAYNALSVAVGDKLASKILSSLGYTGIKYPAGTIMGGAEENDTNYVIFKPEDMKITEHTKFSLRLKSAIEETETNPSDAQKESGNYKKGHIKFGGYDYTIENPKGSTRSGKDADGKEWKVIMHDTYGYIRGKFGKDGDHLDMFINDKADLDNWNGDVFVVDQVNPDGSFDEHKVMYGYDSMDDAKKAYLANYSDGWQGLGNITGVSKDEFDKWLDTSNRKLKPFADYAKVKFSLKDIKPVGVGAFGNIYNQFRGNAKAAIEFLKKVRGGEAVGALHHKDIGDIDLVWGKEGTGHSDGYGLSKLVKYHPEVLDNLQEILNDMRVVSSSKNRVNLESETHKAGVRLTWDGERKSWLLTAFKKETSASDKRTDTAATSLEGDTALSQTEGSAAKIDNSSETAKENGEKVDVEAPKTFDEFLNHPSLKFSIKNEQQRKAAEDAYEYASKLRPNKSSQYALVDMSNPSSSPEYYEKKALADRWRRFYNKAVHNELDDVYKDAWGNYKLFDLDRPFADQVNEVKGDVPNEFNAPDVVANKNADNESGAEYHEYKQDEQSSITYKDRYKAFKQRVANREKTAGLRKERKEVEDSYNSKSKQRLVYNKQLMKEYMDKHGLSSENDIPYDVWEDLRSKSFEKYQDELDSLFNKYKDLDKQIKAVAEPRFSLKDEKIKSVAEKFGVNEDDVAMYANAVERGSTADAARARANIKRYLLQANEDKISSFKELMKYTVPVNKALKENFGDLDAMIEERRKQVEAERNAMEAARKRAQEEEEKRQKHLDELSLIPTDELDKRYMDAIGNNDESTAREMLDESARRKGYDDADSDYQGQGAWAAPSNPLYESDEERRADIDNSPDVNLEDIALGYSLQPDDYFDNPRAYMNNTAYGLESVHVIKNALDAIKNGEKDVKVKVYRAVPTSVKEGKLRNGDWVTPSKKYAEMHGDNRLEGKYRIIEDEVPANQLWWDGNDANEFGFDDGKEYRYKNAKNNRKLNDLITYDNKGNVIPPSKRFNSRKNDVRFSLAGERGAADMAEDLKSLNTPDEVDDAIKTAIEDMPSGWQMANRKMIHIAQALGENRKAEIAGEEPKFSLKDGTLIKAGTYFSGGGLVEEGLKGIIDPVLAVEYDEKISGVYRNNFGQHIVTADVRDVDPKELVKQIDGEVEYFHASPVCKNYSQAKSNHAEVELDKETAASTAEFINAIKPKVVTIENVKGYKDSDAMKTITDALDANGYTWDADVYNAADYGGYTNRERLIVRAVRDGKLPEKPKKMAHKSGWYEAVEDIIPTLTEKKNGVAPWMDIRLKADGIDWRNIDKPLYVMGSAYADGKVPHAFADELLPTLRTKSGDVIVMPDGKVYRAMGRVLARVSGVSDDYKMPFSENLSHTIIGNGIPTQLTEHVIAPLLTGSDPKFSIRTYHGTGAKFDKFDLSHALEGEGSETFGRGVYVTNSKDIGDNYAQRAKDRKGKFGFDYKIDMSADARQMLNHYINKNQDVDKGLENARQDLKSALEMFPDEETLKELSAILQKKNDEIAEASNDAYRYDVDIPDDNGENYLGWNDSQNFPLEKWYRLWEITHHGFNENEYFKDGGARYDKDRIERIIQMKLESPENGMQKLPTLKGEELYQALRDFFDRERPWHGAELTSRALKEIGFIGIKYPAGLIHGGAKEGDYNYVIFDENNANIVGNTRFSLRYDQFEHDLNQWKKDNNLPKDAQRPTIPHRNAGESAVDFLRRVDEYRKQMALWKTAPTYEQHLLSDDTALGEFNRELQRGSVLKRIAFQDSMLAIRKAQEAIMKEVGVDRLNMAEDAYTAENRSHGKGKNEFEEYNNEFLQPLRKAYHQMKKILGDSYDNVRIYMMAKHGLERDAQMAFKKSLEADYEDVAQRSAAYKAYKGDMNRIINDSDLEFGRVDFTTWRQRDNALRTKYSPSYMDYRYDENGIAYDYSGLSALYDGSDFEEAAYKLVKDIEDKYVTETHNLWDATNAATKKILRDGYKAGMMSKDTYQYVRDMYSHYIPLRGWDGTTADQVWDYIGGGKGAFNQTLKKAHGRTSIADDPIAYIENMAESGILLNNKNWVKQHLMLLAQNHPTSLLTLSKAWYVKSVDDNGNEEWIPATPQITSQMDSNQVKAAIDAFEKKMEKMAQTGDATQKRDGLNIAYPQTHSEEREHEVRVMKDGEEYVIYVNGDPQLAQAMNNTRAHRVREIQSGKLDRAAAWLGRKMAAAYTSLSPLFIPSNYFRDLTMTLASTAIREDGRYNYLLRKNLATSWNLGFMLRDYQNGKLRDKVNNGNATPKEQMFYDFMMNGGETGFVSSLDVEDLKKKFKNDLKDLDRWKANPVKVGHTIMDSIEFLNRMIEDSNRFAVYMTSIQYGRSIDEAVNDAKDVTLNFNRKGTGEYGWQMIRNLYLFINPAVQSLQTLGALAKHHPFKFTAVTASWLASGVLVPIVNAALMSMLGGDDDNKDKYWQFTKWDRRNNLIMWVPFTHEYVKIPLAQEFRAFYGIGDMIASKMMGGELAEESWSQYAEDLLGQVVDMLPLDPTGYDGNIAVSLMPNAIRPVFELAFNVDFTGKPLFKETEYNKYDPNFTKAYVGTPDWLVRASRMVNSIGNDYPDVQQNSIDAFGDPKYNLNNPAVVDHVLSSYLGGAYTMGSQVLGVLTKSLNDPKEIKVADIPLVSKFVSNPDDRPVTKKQGDEFWNMKENHDRAANTLSKLKKQAKVDGDYSMLERFYGSEEYKQYKQDDVKVKKYEEDKKKERAEESGEEYRPHKLNAEDIYKAHATPKDDFEDLKLKQLYTKLNGFKTAYDLLVDTAPSQSDGYYNTNKAAIDAIDEISLDKQEISELKKGFLDDGKDAYNAEDMKQIRDLRKKILAVLEKANKVVVANQKAKAEK
jgi:site-specific DNA-cytosine methylase